MKLITVETRRKVVQYWKYTIEVPDDTSLTFGGANDSNDDYLTDKINDCIGKLDDEHCEEESIISVKEENVTP